jgi:hypothetical protein
MTTKQAKISMRGFAEVVSAKPSKKQSKLKQYKFPQAEDSVGRSNYYVKAISAIKRHHRGQTDFVNALLQKLLAEATIEKNPWTRAKLQNNYRAITDYLKSFGKRPLVIKPGKHLYYVHKDLVISAHPDLVAEENGKLLLIKLNFCKDDFGGGVTSTLLHVLYESAQLQGIPVKPSGVECLQTSSGSRVAGSNRGFPDKKNLDVACEEVLALWPVA